MPASHPAETHPPHGGGPGTAYLYVRPDLAKNLEPSFTGWMGHRNPFGFEIGPTQYTDSIYRFTQGTPNIAALHAARPGVKIVAEAGVAAIREKSKRQTAHLIEMADNRGWRVNTPRDAERRGGTVSIDMPRAEQVCTDLLKRNVLVDYRPKAGVRFSRTSITPMRRSSGRSQRWTRLSAVGKREGSTMGVD